LHLLPLPKILRRGSGSCPIPAQATLRLPADLERDTELLPAWKRLREAFASAGSALDLTLASGQRARVTVEARRDPCCPNHPESYTLRITPRGILLGYLTPAGLRASIATLRQLLREHGLRLPCLNLSDWPDFGRRGVMLDISRGKVPRLDTLLQLLDLLADFKINEFQLYTEHTFAYRDFEPVWRDSGALTGADIVALDARCRTLGIDLVPNQNSFGHLRPWLEHPPLKRLGETKAPWPDQHGAFLRYPSTLAPTHPKTLPFLRSLFDELLPHFSSPFFNVGCDETWDLGLGQSRKLCQQKGKGRVYLDFLLQIHREVVARGRHMMCWGDILLHHPELVAELPPDIIALNWGYEADHPFEREAPVFAASGVPFYVCPGTATWMTLIGRHDTAFTNLRRAATVGREHRALGYLNTDWGDGGHPQPLAVSLLPYALGAALAWGDTQCTDAAMLHVVSRDAFGDPSGKAAQSALAMGLAHQKFQFRAPNITPFGATIAAPPPARRELFCRDGLKYYARIRPENIHAALAELESQRKSLSQAKPSTPSGTIYAQELDLAARMAAQSCHYMLWQQMLASGKGPAARREARLRVRDLRELLHDFNAFWPSRNQGDPARCAGFLQWRIDDYLGAKLHFTPAQSV
jgi:hypothetical protein